MKLPESKLTKLQYKHFEKTVDYGGKPTSMLVTLRYDDSCNNGSNSFGITGEIVARKNPFVCGCIHDDIEKHFPELAHLIPWHLTSSNGPMHYAANALYHASNRDYNGKLKGEAFRFETKLFFNDVPIPYKNTDQKFIKWLQSIETFDGLELLKVNHRDNAKAGAYQYGAHYTFKQFQAAPEWYQCPFSDKQEAEQILKALQTCKVTFESEATSWGEGKTPDLEAARSCAVWPEATLEDFTKEKLEARLPELMGRFKNAMESIGFIY